MRADSAESHEYDPPHHQLPGKFLGHHTSDTPTVVTNKGHSERRQTSQQGQTKVKYPQPPGSQASPLFGGFTVIIAFTLSAWRR